MVPSIATNFFDGFPTIIVLFLHHAEAGQQQMQSDNALSCSMTQFKNLLLNIMR